MCVYLGAVENLCIFLVVWYGVCNFIMISVVMYVLIMVVVCVFHTCFVRCLWWWDLCCLCAWGSLLFSVVGVWSTMIFVLCVMRIVGSVLLWLICVFRSVHGLCMRQVCTQLQFWVRCSVLSVICWCLWTNQSDGTAGQMGRRSRLVDHKREYRPPTLTMVKGLGRLMTVDVIECYRDVVC